MASKGKLIVYYGCMFAGKTTSLIKHISESGLKNHEFLVMKPALDIRSGKNTITTHDGRSHECIIYERDIDISPMISPYTRLLAIDEAQFFDKIFMTDIRRLLGKGIDVVAAGLDKDYLGRPFGLMPALIEIADEKIGLKAKCAQCGNDAEFTYRKADNKVLILIGQENYYEPRCSDCINH